MANSVVLTPVVDRLTICFELLRTPFSSIRSRISSIMSHVLICSLMDVNAGSGIHWSSGCMALRAVLSKEFSPSPS